MQGAVEERLEILLFEGAEDVDLTAAQQRGDHLEGGVFGCGADERDDPLLDGPEQGILLGFVEAVYLVDEEEGRFLVEKALFSGRFDHFADLLDSGCNGREGEEGSVELRGDDPGEGGLADARRPPEDERGDVSRFEEFAEDAFRAHEMLLPDVFIEGAGSETFGQGNIGHGITDLRCKDRKKSRISADPKRFKKPLLWAAGPSWGFRTFYPHTTIEAVPLFDR